MSDRRKKNSMPEQSPAERRRNFAEVALGYDAETARCEAARCLQCKTSPCRQGCPVEVDIPGFILHIRNGDFAAANEDLLRYNALPAVCGRVCPQEDQCEKLCVLGKNGEPVAIGRLERFAADYARENLPPAPVANVVRPDAPRVAIVGSGPAGVTAAGELAKMGYRVTVFEALHMPGGVLMYGIPEFRLPKAIVQHEIGALRAMGVEIVSNAIVGKSITVDELMNEEGYQAVFIGTGAGLPYFMGIPGENANGVFSANEFLTRSNLMQAWRADSPTPIFVGRRSAVVGGGNVAMDAARTAVRLGAEEVFLVYRRSRQEMPARHEEIDHALEEGVIFRTLTNPTAVRVDDRGWVSGLECVEMELGEPDESGRRRPVVKPGSEHFLPVDSVIMAIGQGPNPLVQSTTPNLRVNRWNNIWTDENGMTSRPGVFAGGDVVTGAATVILAMGAGKRAAQAIDRYLREQK
ncbi:MAG: NADPH-dependent glutamate synthase [Negativicutes bacterium]|nr:NADPH-dependent glutamate synthase [Negativicutes bacterium]